MGIITVARGSYSHGKEVAEKVAKKLGYDCISREDILEALEEFNAPEIRMIQALEDVPSILDRLIHGKRKYMAHTRSALLHRLRKGKVVYHGFAGHFFLEGIPHVLKVLITAAMEHRVSMVMERHGISRKRAFRLVSKVDDQRRRWGKALYGINAWDPCLYDLTLHINEINVEDAVEILCRVSSLPQFQMTSESEKAMDDMFIALSVEIFLLDAKPRVEIIVDNKFVYLKTPVRLRDDSEVVSRMDDIMDRIPGVTGIKVIR